MVNPMIMSTKIPSKSHSHIRHEISLYPMRIPRHVLKGHQEIERSPARIQREPKIQQGHAVHSVSGNLVIQIWSTGYSNIQYIQRENPSKVNMDVV